MGILIYILATITYLLLSRYMIIWDIRGEGFEHRELNTYNNNFISDYLGDRNYRKWIYLAVSFIPVLRISILVVFVVMVVRKSKFDFLFLPDDVKTGHPENTELSDERVEIACIEVMGRTDLDGLTRESKVLFASGFMLGAKYKF